MSRLTWRQLAVIHRILMCHGCGLGRVGSACTSPVMDRAMTADHVKRRLTPTVLLAACFMAGILAASDGFAADGATQSATLASSTDQLNIGRAYEAAGRFADAEVAYRKALEFGSPGTRADALAALSKVVRARADSLLFLARSLEGQGRSSDAEETYLEVLKAGDPQSRSAALDGLRRLLPPKDSGSGLVTLQAAQVLKKVGRWEDSEALYRQVLQTGTPEQRQAALAQIKSIASIRDSFQEEHVIPVWQAFLKIVVSVVGLIILIVPAGHVLKWFFRRRYRDRLCIRDFASTKAERSPGAAFGETLKLMHARMSTYSRPRTIVGQDGKMPVLLIASSSDVLDLITGVDESLLPFREWFSKVMNQPGYEISGWTEATWWNIKVCAKLEHSGQTIRQWTRTYPADEWFGAEQDLAYEIMLSLKEYTDAYAA